MATSMLQTAASHSQMGGNRNNLRLDLRQTQWVLKCILEYMAKDKEKSSEEIHCFKTVGMKLRQLEKNLISLHGEQKNGRL